MCVEGIAPFSEKTVIDFSWKEKQPSEKDRELFNRIISTEISMEVRQRLETPEKKVLGVKSVLGVHWHPEFIPLDICEKRVRLMFPESTLNLIIPTQHNEIMTLGRYSGAEVDCYSGEFNRKIQLLLHFKDIKKEKTSKLRSMISHTFNYRSSQMHELLNALCEGKKGIISKKAAESCGAFETTVDFAAAYAAKLALLLAEKEKLIDKSIIKNKLVRNFFDELREIYEPHLIDLCQIYIKAVKEEVKKTFSNDYFFGTKSVIEEARAAGAGIVVPHPEQFWPVLLADYDVDGYEVWNPQSRQFTEFMIDVVRRKQGKRRKLIFMGDDTHMGEKARPVELQDREKAEREIGWQPAWKDPEVKKMLSVSGFSKEMTINEYEARL